MSNFLAIRPLSKASLPFVLSFFKLVHFPRRKVPMATFLRRAVVLCLLLSGGAGFAQKGKATAPAAPPAQTIKLSVDATRAPEKLLHATMQLPVRPGPLTLVYPKWIPGEHGPTGPIADLTGVQFYAGSQRLSWQ